MYLTLYKIFSIVIHRKYGVVLDHVKKTMFKRRNSVSEVITSFGRQ